MKLIIFGATGMMGKELVKQALYNGHIVKAYGRNVFTEDMPKDDNLELVQGALFDEGQVYHAIKGCDAVLSALGGAYDGTDKTRSLGMKNIVLQMKKAGVKRIVAVGGMGLLDNEVGKLIMEEDDFPPALAAVTQEHFKAYQFLKDSGLDWTFVCPPTITEGEPTGVFQTEADLLPESNNNKISSGDLALFMLKELDQHQYGQHRVGISA
ncbi:MAG: SDR family oxidoreductase [Chitinophagaceae bacterium]|nr:SDR family oxidoreductase [Chitinophagaceae bacterium]